MKSGRSGPEGNIEDLRDLPHGQVEVVVQGDDGPLVDVESAELGQHPFTVGNVCRRIRDPEDIDDRRGRARLHGAADAPDRRRSRRRDPTEDGRYLPFRFGTSFSYSRNSVSDISNASGNFTFSANVTRTWEFSYRASFDLVAGRINRQEYSLHRDLHCWKLEFTRIISNIDQQFGFRLYLRGMPDLKLARGREDLLGTATSGIGGALF